MNIQNIEVPTDTLATGHAGAGDQWRRTTNTVPVMKEACDMVGQGENMFSQSDHLIAAKLLAFPKVCRSFS